MKLLEKELNLKMTDTTRKEITTFLYKNEYLTRISIYTNPVIDEDGHMDDFDWSEDTWSGPDDLVEDLMFRMDELEEDLWDCGVTETDWKVVKEVA